VKGKPTEEARVPSKKRNGRQHPLRREEIVATAIAAAERGELQQVTMRGLAEQLGVTPMALYAHVEDKDDLLDEVLDHVLRRDASPRPFSPDDGWRSWMIDFAEQLYAALAGHPALFDRYCRRPVGAPAALERMEAATTVLSTAGFDDDASVDVYANVIMLVLGFTALDSGLASPARFRHGLTVLLDGLDPATMTKEVLR
jgi:AcrR family transcriptional regulator